jgi:hypothetical protein
MGGIGFLICGIEVRLKNYNRFSFSLFCSVFKESTSS